jgi:uncharacterized protein (TIGR02246 family)
MIDRLSAVLGVAVLVCACAGEQEAGPVPGVPDTSADEAAIEQIRADYVTHYNLHHASVVADLFEDSAVALWADGNVNQGKAAILVDLEADMAGAPNLTLTPGETMVFGDRAVAHGTYSVSTTPPGAPAALTLAGSYLTNFLRTGAGWKIAGVISNMAAAPPEGFAMGDLSALPEPPENGTMQAFGATFSQHFAAGDWAALAGHYTEDAFVGFTEAPPIEGRAAIQARFQERFAGATEQQIEIHDVATLDLGDGWALDGGWFTVTIATPAGRMVQTGTYNNLLRAQPDGSWQIHWGLSNGHLKPAP